VPIGPLLTASVRMSETCGVPFFDVSAAFKHRHVRCKPLQHVQVRRHAEDGMRVPAGALSRNSSNCLRAYGCEATGVFR